MDEYIGIIKMFAGNFEIQNFMSCSGQTLSISQNAALFSILGTTFGGNGTSTFQLPNMQGRFPIGVGNGAGLSQKILGESAGTETVTLTIAEIPAHVHSNSSLTATLSGVTETGNKTSPTGNLIAASRSNTTAGFAASGTPTQLNSNSIAISGATAATGGSQPHTIMPPYLAVTFLICINGIYPSRN